VKENFPLVVMVIISVSIMPGIVEFFRARTKIKQGAKRIAPENEI
jgi:hypothetical protein